MTQQIYGRVQGFRWHIALQRRHRHLRATCRHFGSLDVPSDQWRMMLVDGAKVQNEGRVTTIY